VEGELVVPSGAKEAGEEEGVSFPEAGAADSSSVKEVVVMSMGTSLTSASKVSISIPEAELDDPKDSEVSYLQNVQRKKY
jgi:hypothetical protein